MTKRLIAGTALLTLIFVIWLVFIANNTRPDEVVFDLVAPYTNGERTDWMKKISFLGNHQFLIPANLLLIAFFITVKKHKDALLVTIVALSSLGLMSLLKNLTQRYRPAYPLVDGITNYSFPSGHALMSVAFYGILAFYAVKMIKNPVIKITILLLLFAVTLLIGFSRIYLRVHYTTDVIAGFSIGVCWMLFCFWLLQKTTKPGGQGL
jgi:membrane-associated phospholipid phosphatase